jgi:hypothetical protein
MKPEAMDIEETKRTVSQDIYGCDPRYPDRFVRIQDPKQYLMVNYSQNREEWPSLIKTIDDALEKRQFSQFVSILNENRITMVDIKFFVRFSKNEIIKHFSMEFFKPSPVDDHNYIGQPPINPAQYYNGNFYEDWLVEECSTRDVSYSTPFRSEIEDETFDRVMYDLIKYMNTDPWFELWEGLYHADFLRENLILKEVTKETLTSDRLLVFNRINRLIQATDPYLINDKKETPIYLAGYNLFGDSFSKLTDEEFNEEMIKDRLSFFRSPFCDFGKKPKWSKEIHLRCPLKFQRQVFILLCISKYRRESFPFGRDILSYLLTFVLFNAFDIEIEEAARLKTIAEKYELLSDEDIDRICLSRLIHPIVSHRAYPRERRSKWGFACKIVKSMIYSKFKPNKFAKMVLEDHKYMLTWHESVLKRLTITLGTIGGFFSGIITEEFSIEELRNRLETHEPSRIKWALICRTFILNCIEDGLNLQDVKDGKASPTERNDKFLKRKYIESKAKKRKL